MESGCSSFQAWPTTLLCSQAEAGGGGVGGRGGWGVGAMCCNQASDEPTGEFLGIKCRGAPPGRTLNPSGFHFGAILVSWGGRSGTVSPKERRRA